MAIIVCSCVMPRIELISRILMMLFRSYDRLVAANWDLATCLATHFNGKWSCVKSQAYWLIDDFAFILQPLSPPPDGSLRISCSCAICDYRHSNEKAGRTTPSMAKNNTKFNSFVLLKNTFRSVVVVCSGQLIKLMQHSGHQRIFDLTGASLWIYIKNHHLDFCF